MPNRTSSSVKPSSRSLDESGEHERAEKVLRDLLSRRSPFEARVRLARILMKKGTSVEAETLLQEVANDALALPRYLKRHHRPWIRAASRLKRGSTKLPKPRVDATSLGALSQRNVFAIAGIGFALLAAGAVALFTFAVYWSLSDIFGAYEERQELRAELDALDREHPWPHGEDLSLVDVSEDELRLYLEIRRALELRVDELVALDPTRAENYDETVFSWFDLFNMFGATSSEKDWYSARTDFDRAVFEELENNGLGPSHLTNMLTIVEWRMLRRDEAMLLGLPDYFREDLVQVRATLESYRAYADEPTAGDVFVDSDWEKDYQRQISRSRAKYDELERQAGENVELSDATTALFDTHRDELAAFEPHGLQYWIKAVDDSLPWP